MRRRALTIAVMAAASGCGGSEARLVCGPGTVQIGDTCAAEPPDCAPGAHLDQGRCVAAVPPAVRCGEGTRPEMGACVPSNTLTTTTATTSWAPNVQVSESILDFATESALAVDSRGNITIAAIIFDHYDPMHFDAGIGVWSSRDGGKSFARVFTPPKPTAHFLGDPAVIYDRSDRLLVGWISYGMTDFSGDLMVSRSMDGSTFSDPELIDPDGVGNFRDRPWFALAQDGSVSLTWVAQPKSSFQFASKRAISTDGAPFSTIETIDPANDLINAPMAFDSAGNAVAIAESLTAWRRTAIGWTSVQAFAPGFALFEIDPQPQVVWTERGGFTVAFVGPPRYDPALYAMHSLDAGRTWTAPVPVAGGALGKSAAALPWMTTDEKGRVHLLWLDNRGGGWAPYTAVSVDGVEFGAAERIGDATFADDGDERKWLGDFNAIVATGGRRYATWADSRRDGRSAIWFSSAPGVP